MANFTNYHFEGQKPKEQILLLLRRHWFDIFSRFFVLISMLVLFLASFLYLPLVFSNFQDGEGRLLFVFVGSLFFMVFHLVAAITWVDYYFDIWIVTNERIVNIEQKGLFSRVVSELKLENIQDITTDVRGVIPTFLNYGNLFVQTAAEKERFIFRNIPNPYQVKDMIMNLQRKTRKKEELEFGEMLKKKIHKEQF